MNKDIIIGILILILSLTSMLGTVIFATIRINKINKLGPSSARELIRKLYGKN